MIRSPLLALALVVGSGAVHAVSWNKNTDFLWNATTGKVDIFAGPGSGNVWGTGSHSMTANGPQIGRDKALPFNPSPTAKFKATFSPAAMAKGFAKGSAIPLAAAVIQSLLTEACVRVAGGAMVSNGSWEECTFTQQQITEYHAVQENQEYPGSWGWARSKPEAAQQWVDMLNSSSGVGDCGAYSPTGIWQPGKFQFTLAQSEPSPIASRTCSVGSSTGQVGGKYFTRNISGEVQSGWAPTSADGAEAKLKTKLEEWTQADFAYGYDRTYRALDELMKGGGEADFSITVDPIQPITSPPRTTSSTTTKPDGTTATTTTTTTTNNTFNTTNTSSTTITITHNQSSTITTTHPDGSTTTTTEGKDPPKPDEQTPPVVDADMPPVPDLYEQKYPDGLAGVWNTRYAEMKQGPLFAFLQSLVPNITGTAGCPSWTWPSQNVLGIQVGGDISVPCYVWTFLRIVMLISAVLMARKLIFGG
ncbi:MAG TPA: hypothetical protein VNT52_17510 [Acidimicrobiales bacterium]|nr:hypothetical protein [Acidimicrobiales bacterium]